MPADPQSRDLPPDVEPEQVWRDPGGQHYRVDRVTNGVATLHRCSPAGRVLNQRHTEKASVERMQSDYELVSGA